MWASWWSEGGTSRLQQPADQVAVAARPNVRRCHRSCRCCRHARAAAAMCCCCCGTRLPAKVPGPTWLLLLGAAAAATAMRVLLLGRQSGCWSSPGWPVGSLSSTVQCSDTSPHLLLAHLVAYGSLGRGWAVTIAVTPFLWLQAHHVPYEPLGGGWAVTSMNGCDQAPV